MSSSFFGALQTSFILSAAPWEFRHQIDNHMLNATMCNGSFFNNNHFEVSYGMPIYVSMWLILSAWYLFKIRLPCACPSKCSLHFFHILSARHFFLFVDRPLLVLALQCAFRCYSLQQNVIDSINVMPCYNKWQRICWDRFRLIRYYRQWLKASHNMWTQSKHTTLHFKRSVILPRFTAFDVNSVCLCKYFFFILFDFTRAAGVAFFFHSKLAIFAYRVHDLLSRMNVRLQCPIWAFFLFSLCYCSCNAFFFFVCVVLMSLQWKSVAHSMVML